MALLELFRISLGRPGLSANYPGQRFGQLKGFLRTRSGRDSVRRTASGLIDHQFISGPEAPKPLVGRFTTTGPRRGRFSKGFSAFVDQGNSKQSAWWFLKFLQPIREAPWFIRNWKGTLLLHAKTWRPGSNAAVRGFLEKR